MEISIYSIRMTHKGLIVPDEQGGARIKSTLSSEIILFAIA